jgi:hypothetical protein
MRVRMLGRLVLAAPFLLAIATMPAAGQDVLYFTAIQDARKPLLDAIAAEPVRIDVAAWWFNDREISWALVRRFRAGVPVRFIADARSYESASTRAEIDFLASYGIPVRLRTGPAGTSEIMHWKCGIFAGQNAVAFGSANWTTYSLRPYSSTNYDDETLLVTRDPILVPAFRMKFDEMWVDTAVFSDFANVTPALRTRHEPDALSPASMVWSQGTKYNARLIAEIDAEQRFIDFVLYRLQSVSVADALVRRARAGVAVRLIIDPAQYRSTKVPEAAANLDRLWAQHVPITQRLHQGMTHMKTLVTSAVATNASSNVGDSWQRDHNYFVERALKPVLYEQLRSRVAAMAADTVGFGTFRPQPPGSATLVTPTYGATGVSVTPVLDWADAPWATNYDVFLGTSTGNMVAVGSRVAGSRLALTTSLLPRTTYYWRVKARTNATLRDASIATTSATWWFTTGAGATQGIQEIVIHAGTAAAVQLIGDWYRVTDASAAGGVRVANPDRGVAKLTAPAPSPASYVDVVFAADAGKPYHLWLRMKAHHDSWQNDSVFVQFDGTVSESGSPVYRIGSTHAARVSLEESSGAGVSGWGWNDSGWEGLGAHLYFERSGTQRLRIQVREDGVSIDHIVLSASRYLTAAPGDLKNDATILR